MHKRKLIFLLGICMVFCTCKKQPTHQHVNPALLAAFNFKVGSYWIYKDSLTGQIDSMYITNSGIDFNAQVQNSQNTYELCYIFININNSNTSNTENWWIQLYDNYFYLCHFGSITDGVENVLSVPPIAYPFSDTTLWFDYDSCYVRTIPTYTVNGKQYMNAALLSFNSSYVYTIAKYNDLFYVDSGVGIIKFIFNHESDTIYRNMELQRYNIVK